MWHLIVSQRDGLRVYKREAFEILSSLVKFKRSFFKKIADTLQLHTDGRRVRAFFSDLLQNILILSC